MEKGKLGEFTKFELKFKEIDYFFLNSVENKCKITQIYLINLNEREITESDIAEYRKNKIFETPYEIESLSKSIEREKEFLSNIRVFNKKDFNIDLSSEDFRWENVKLPDLFINSANINEISFVGIGPFLTVSLAEILLKVKSCFIYTIKHLAIVKPKDNFIIEIANPHHYLAFYILFEKQTKLDPNNLLFTRHIVLTDKLDSMKPQYFSEIDEKELLPAFDLLRNKIHSKFFLFGKEDFLMNKFILETQDIMKPFEYFDCIGGDFQIKNTKKAGFVFYNVDKLSNNKLYELIENLNRKPNSNKVIILTGKREIDTIKFHDYKVVHIPSYRGSSKYFNKYLALMFREKKMYDSPETIINKTDYFFLLNLTLINPILKIIPSFSELATSIEFLNENYEISSQLGNKDFWYEFVNFIQNKYPLKNQNPHIEEETQNLQSVDENNSDIESKYQFIKKKNDKYKIVFNGQEIELRNDDRVGLFYIYYLIKYAEQEPIHVRDLFNNRKTNPDKYSGKPAMGYLDELIDEGGTETIDFETSKKPRLEMDVISDEDQRLKTSIEKIKDQIREWEEELDENEDLNIEEIEEIEENVKKAKIYLNKSLMLNGSFKEIKSVNQTNDLKMKNAVSKAIKAAKVEIKEIHPVFYNYLCEVIKYNEGKYTYSYLPAKEIVWTF